MVLLLCMPLPEAWKTPAAWYPHPAALGRFSWLLSHCSTQRPRGPVCWPGCLLLPGDGLPAIHTHRQHPSGPPGIPAATLLHGYTQRHHSLPEHGGGGCLAGWQRMSSPWADSCSRCSPCSRRRLCCGMTSSLCGYTDHVLSARTWGSGWPWCRSWACWRPLRLPKLLVRLHQAPVPVPARVVSAGAWGAGMVLVPWGHWEALGCLC